MPLPRLSDSKLVLGELSQPQEKPFLRVERLCLRLGVSTPFSYDVVTRAALDAVVIAAHFRVAGERHVFLRSAVRPPLWWRNRGDGALWEMPAGLVEPGESFRDAAARELFEEVGARVTPSALLELGPPMLPAPGMIAEVQAYFHVEVDPAALAPPPGDSSALEGASVVAPISVREALALCASGVIRDAKTELVLRRLATRFAIPDGVEVP